MAKRRTAKQRAATKKLVALNKRRKKSGTKKGMRRKTARRAFEGIRKKARKVRKSTPLKTRKRRRSMARRGIKSITGSSTLKKVALGIGGATMFGLAAAAIAPQFSRVAAPAGAYFLGGIEGVLGNFALDFMRGRTVGNGTAQNAAPAMEVL
jgi:hypothetical protein